MLRLRRDDVLEGGGRTHADEEVGFMVVSREVGVGLFDLVPGFLAGCVDGAVGFGVLEGAGQVFAAGPDRVVVALGGEG